MIQSILDFSFIMVEYFTTLFDRIRFVWEFSIGDIVPIGLRPLTDPILNTICIKDFSLLAFIFGAGIVTYITYSIITWVLNLVT